MKNQKMNAILLAGIMLFETVFAGMLPINAQTVSQNEIVAEENILSENTTVSEETMEVQDEGEESDKLIGTDGGVNWSIDENGHLLLTGDGDYEEMPDWISYRSEIKSAKVTVTNMTNTSYMFYRCENMIWLDVSEFDTSKVTDMSMMFEYCYSLKNLDVSQFDTSNVTDMSEMFFCCQSLTSLDVSDLDTSNVTDMSDMFANCQSLTSLDISGFDTSKVTDMSMMFANCYSLEDINIGILDASNVTDMYDMFGYCESLKSLDLSGLYVPHVERVMYMFQGCSQLESIELFEADSGQITSISGMFTDCRSLTELDLSYWNFSGVYSYSNYPCFTNMDALIKLTINNGYLKMELPDMFYDDENVLMDVTKPTKKPVTYIRAEYVDNFCIKNGHDYAEPIFIWNPDYSKVKARFQCLRDDCRYDSNIIISGVVTKKTIQPTTEKEGATVYTAAVVLNGKTYTDIKSFPIEKLPATPDAEASAVQESQAIGTTLNVTTTIYRVTKAGKTPEVAYMGPRNKKVKKVTIPATVTIDGVTYKVTSVATGALKNYKNLTTVTIGKNVTKIGKNAFCGCKKLNKIVIKSKKLKSVGKNAFKGIKKNATIDVPNSKKKAYKKLFKSKTGFKKKTMKVK